MIILFIITAVLVILGVLFHKGKCAYLIAGYSTLSPDEKEKIDLPKLYKGMSAMMFICAACFVLLTIAIYIDNIPLIWLALGLLVGSCVCGVIFMNAKKRLYKE